MTTQAHIYIKGDVIGVGFRAWTKIQAKFLHINGWVKNKEDCVETVIQGPREKVEEMIDLLKKGPPISRVDDVEVLPQEAKELFDSFEIRK